MNERSGPSGGLEPAVRLFAGELARTRFFEGGTFLSPTGACGRRVFFAGALTAVWTGEGRVCARVADPTGTLLLSAGWRESEAAAALQAMEVPAFVAVTGRPVPDEGGPSLVPETVVLAARQVRDTWVLRTADLTLSRAEAVLAVLSDEGADPDALAAVERYALTPDVLAELLQMVKDALESVHEGDGTGAAPLDARALVISLLEEAPGRRAAEADLVAAAGERGIGQAEAEAAIEALMAEGECYMPSTGQVRLI
ncbi:hypothetical protein E2N92_03010 [Methanofollis formosanus]|uniref:Uncharacterized protein n=1 Tax=Methanofollis formosanus TaxID=299308 RepID=A0A8G0ZZU4_9EURY|nr:hypothetical protein [Methanofollis formosanus]QYZ78470.1 hypothetical protein E2N92_03010 [Methanofollis formosanus]